MTDYKRCRVCLVSAGDAELSSLRENGGIKVVLLEKLFGINLTNDNQEALICENCLKIIDLTISFVDNARRLDETYFAAARFVSSCGSDNDWPRVCRCCRSASHLRRMTEATPELVPIILLITGIDVHDDQDKCWICSSCEKNLRCADLLNFIINDNEKLHFNKKTAAKVEVAAKDSPMANQSESKQLAARIQCTECSKSYSSAKILRRHVLDIHETSFNCNFCDYKTSYQPRFIHHLSTHLDIAEGKTKPKSSASKEKSAVCLTCQVCSEDFNSLASIKQHYVKKHQSLRKFECDYCGWRSVQKRNLANHITCKHLIKSLHDMYDKERRFKCTFKDCQKRFKVYSLLRQHITRTHRLRPMLVSKIVQQK